MSRSDPPLQIRLLGPLGVIVAGRPVVVDTRKALAIVALVAAEGRPFARDELAAMFWPEADDEAARGALRRTLSALRTAVDGTGIHIERTLVTIDPVVPVDLVTLQRLAASPDRADLEAAAAIARGPFLTGFTVRDSPAFDDWQAAWATRVERMVGQLLDDLAAARTADGDLLGAIEAGRRRVALDPLDEGGQRRLIERLARSGDRAAAIAQYRALVGLFDHELGVSPLGETTELYDAIREGSLDPGSPVPVIVPTTTPRARPAPVPGRLDGPLAVPLVGREADLVTLLEAWRVATPDGRVAILEGEAGIGKTRLAETVVAAVKARGGRVLTARGYPGESAIAYVPIAEVLRAGLSLPGGAARLAALDEIARGEIGRLVDLPLSSRSAGRPAPDGAGARVRLLDAIARAITALATGPVPGLVWIDDLHLLDGSSREAAAYLARRLTGRSFMLLLAWRREDLPADGLAVADELVRIDGAPVVALGRFDRTAVARLIGAVRPAAMADGSLDALVDALLEDSEGLPLYVVEALGPDGSPGSAIPRGFQAMLRQRIASVGETAGQVLAAAAVIGRSFDLATVRQASGRTEEEAIGALEELMHRGIVRETEGSIGRPIRYDFSHGRMREVAYASISLARRRLLHQRTAAALRLDLGRFGRDDISRFALIGAHEREAGRPAEAAHAYREAADRAEAMYASREAIEQLVAVLALGASDPAAVHVRIGELRSRLGEYPAAVSALETAAALADSDGLPAIEVALGRVHRRRGDLATAASHLASALASPGLTEAWRARSLVERSLVALRVGDLELAASAADEATLVAARLGDVHTTGVAERLTGLVAQARGDGSAARESLERSLAIAVDDPDPTAAIAASIGLAITLAAEGSVDDAIATAMSAVEACQRIGDRHLEAAVENHLADICHHAGREDDAMFHLKRAVTLFAEVGEGGPEPDPGVWALAAW